MAKRKNLIIFLSAIISVIFAFICGPAIAFGGLTINARNNTNNLAYLARQNHIIVNDTISNPILFGEGSKNTDVSIQYSYGYAVDIRIQYSLSWSNSRTTDNVILNFADRDNYIVDDQYIYYKNSISGTGTLRVFTGVNFVDPKDSNYDRALLTINIVNVTVQKANLQTYNTSNSLYTSSVAGNAWINYKNTSNFSNDAFVVVYNYRYNADHSIAYPTSTAGNSNGVDLMGNRYYAGTGLYVIAKNNVQIKVRTVPVWSGSTTYIDNVNYNYSSNWTETNYRYETGNSGTLIADTNSSAYSNATGVYAYKDATYNYYIPSGTACYIEVLDNIEIISVMYTNGLDYTDSSLYTNSVIVNGSSFGSSKITSGTISTGSYGVSIAYSKSDIGIINSSLYENHMYDTSAGVSSSMITSVNIVNNTANYKKISVSYNLVYVLSNGGTSRVDSSAQWVKTKRTSTSLTVYGAGSTSSETTFVIAPYSSVSIADRITVAATLATEINSYTSSNSSSFPSADYDVWLEVQPVITDTSGTMNLNSDSVSLDVEVSVSSAGTITAFIKNTSDAACTVSINNIHIYTYNSNNAGSSINVSALTGNDTTTTLAPNEKVALTLSVNSLSNYDTYTYMISAGAKATYSSATNAYLVNEGTANAYVINTSNTKKTIKLNGTGDNVIVQPGQIISVASSVSSITIS